MRVAGDLWSTAQFLVSKKSLARTLPTGRYLRVPHQQVTREGLYTRAINGTFLYNGLAGCDANSCGRSHRNPDFAFETPTIAHLLARPAGHRARPNILAFTTRSTCQNLTILGTGAWELYRHGTNQRASMLDFKGNFSDGNYAIGFGNQHSYSDSRSCTWLVTSNGTGTVVEVQFEKFSFHTPIQY